MNVSQIMERDLTAIGDDDTLEQAIETLIVNKKVGLPVVDHTGVVVGFLNEKNIIDAALPGYLGHLDDKFVLPDIAKLRTRLAGVMGEPVHKFMNRNVVTFQETEPILNILIALNQKNIRTASIIQGDGYLTGVVNREDTLIKRLVFNNLEEE